MQNAWRFVDDEVLRERLKEAKGTSHEAPQARSQDRLQASGVNCASCDGADEEVSETQGLCHCHSTDSRTAKFRNRYATANSLWQQRDRSEARRPLWLGEMVCAAWC
jgi:hypothetical protein